MSRYDTVLPERQITSLDALEVLQNAGKSAVLRRGEAPVTGGLLTGTNAGVSRPAGATDGMFWWNFTTALNTQANAILSLSPGWPVGDDYTGVPAAALLPRLWQFQLSVQRFNLIATSELYFGIVGNTASAFTGTVFPLYGLRTCDTENAGRWTVYRRARKNGAIVKVDTGIAVNAGQTYRLELQYRDTTNPSISMLIDGVVVDTAVGIANVPQQGPNDNDWIPCIITGNNPGPAGQQDRWRQARLIITELPGYP